MNQLAIFAFWVLECCVTYTIVIGIQFACVSLSMKEEDALLKSCDERSLKQWLKIVDHRVELVKKWWIAFPLSIATFTLVSLVFRAFFPFLP